MLQEGVVAEVLGAHKATELLGDNAVNVWRLDQAKQFLHPTRPEDRCAGHIRDLDGLNNLKPVLSGGATVHRSLGRDPGPILAGLALGRDADEFDDSLAHCLLRTVPVRC